MCGGFGTRNSVLWWCELTSLGRGAQIPVPLCSAQLGSVTQPLLQPCHSFVHWQSWDLTLWPEHNQVRMGAAEPSLDSNLTAFEIATNLFHSYYIFQSAIEVKRTLDW